MTPEQRLHATLTAAPGRPCFWWRDDDAGRDHPRLARLLRLAATRNAPVSLAVVPDWLEEACAESIRGAPHCAVLQHGIAHADHAAGRSKKIELGGTADRGQLRRSLVAGRQRLEASFGERFLAILVPPWNRIAPDLTATLPGLGYAGLSVYGPRVSAEPVSGLRRLNTHLDLIDWRDGARPLTFEEAADRLAALVGADLGEPIGILSHHLVMSDGAFATLDRLLGLVLDHPRGEVAGVGALIEEGR